MSSSNEASFRAAVLICLVTASATADYPFQGQGPYRAKDSLSVGEEQRPDARECLAGLAWEPSEFQVRLEAPTDSGDLLVRFPTPRPTGNATNDLVAMEWYLARDPAGGKIEATPIIVVHEIGRNMAAGRAMAIALSRVGHHAFLVQLPSYGERAGARRLAPAKLPAAMRQGIADVRRARDAVTMLPTVRKSHVALQGTSLGGIICATAGSLDSGFDSVHLLLAGGDLVDIIQHGKRDTAKVREEFRKAGVTDDQMRDMMATIEPLRIAHRLRPASTWLYSGRHDTVIPLKNARKLAAAASLTPRHHHLMNADHYSGVVYLPWVVADIATHVRGLTR